MTGNHDHIILFLIFSKLLNIKCLRYLQILIAKYIKPQFFKLDSLCKPKCLFQYWKIRLLLICLLRWPLPFDLHSFDIVFTNWLLMYLEDEEVRSFMQRALSWLREDGLLFFRESCFHSSGTHSHHISVYYLHSDSRVENWGWCPRKGYLWNLLFCVAEALYLMNLPVDQANSRVKYGFYYAFMVKVKFSKFNSSTSSSITVNVAGCRIVASNRQSLMLLNYSTSCPIFFIFLRELSFNVYLYRWCPTFKEKNHINEFFIIS